MYQDDDDGDNAQGGEGGSKQDVRVAIDKSFALEMKKRFGQEDDFDDGLFYFHFSILFYYFILVVSVLWINRVFFLARSIFCFIQEF